MAPRLLFLAVLVVFLTGRSTVTASWLSDQLNSLTSSVSSWFNNLSSSFDRSFSKLSQRFSNMTANVKQWFTKRSFANATAAQMLAQIPQDGWREISPALLMTANQSQITKLLDTATGRVPQRMLDELNRLLIINQTSAQAISMAKNNINSMSLSDIITLTARLGDVVNWTVENITNLGPTALILPVCVDSVRDDQTAQAVVNVIQGCLVPSPDPSCPTVPQLSMLVQMMNLRIQGPPANWTTSTVISMGGVNLIPTYAIPYLSNKLILNALPDIAKVPVKAPMYITCEKWKQAVCRAYQCSNMDAMTTKNWYGNLGTLQACVGPSDISSAALTDPTLKLATYNASIMRGKDINPQDASIILQDFFTNKTVDSITTADVNSLGGPLMMRAPACYIKSAADRSLLTTVLPNMDSSVLLVKGPEFPAKTRALMQANMKTALVSGVFTSGQILSSLKVQINPSLLKDQSTTILKQIVDFAYQKRAYLSTFQIDTILSKLSASDLAPYPPFFREYASTVKIGNLNLYAMVVLAKNMSSFSLPCLRGANMTFGGMYNISVDEINSGMEFLRCMSAVDAQKVSPDDLFNVFEAIKATGKPLSMSACRVFRDMLVEWAATNLPSNLTSLQDVASQLFLQDVTVVPPCVLVDLGDAALKVMTKQMKKVALMQLCKMNSGLSSIPQDKRRNFINSIVNDMMSVPGAKIGICELDMLGSCVFDLTPQNLRMMNEPATMEFIKRLQMSFMSPVPPCLDVTQKQQIGQMIITVMGPPATWKDASDISCLLDTLSSTSLMSIPPEVFISVNCKPLTTHFEDGQPDMCKTNAKASYKKMSEMQASNCINLRNTVGSGTNCDKILCNGLAVMTSADINSLQLQDVYDNLADLAAQEMTMAQAQALLTKVRQLSSQGNLTTDNLNNLGYIYQAFTANDMANLNWTNPRAKSMIYQIGRMKMMPDDVMTAAKDQILSLYQTPPNMNSQDLMLLGQIICVFTQSQINNIPVSAFLGAMRYLGILNCNNKNGTVYLAQMALAAYKSDNRDLPYWDGATMSEMGLLMGGLGPEQLTAIPPQAYSGLTSAGVKSIAPGALKALKVAQIQNLSPSTAAAITPDQMAQFNTEMMVALNRVLPSTSPRSSATSHCISGFLGGLSLLLALLLA
ncbi:uncharacterized protein [Cherax quadricarinatus]|uniref:uncharacterized protein isoform X2 n=1 Tax=Cherax quadricarinatus TaxID=27406 RepID=UPI00387E5F4D